MKKIEHFSRIPVSLCDTNFIKKIDFGLFKIATGQEVELSGVKETKMKRIYLSKKEDALLKECIQFLKEPKSRVIEMALKIVSITPENEFFTIN